MQYLKNRTLLLELQVWSFARNIDERVSYQLDGYLGGEYTFVGFPMGLLESAESGENDKGTESALICADNLMALSARSDNMGGAWDFARYYLTDEYQKSLKSSLPVK